jgi:hypothetical protein
MKSQHFCAEAQLHSMWRAIFRAQLPLEAMLRVIPRRPMADLSVLLA